MARTHLILKYRYRVGALLKPLQFVLLHFGKWFTAIGNSTINTFNETKSSMLVVRLHIHPPCRLRQARV